jgi:hypothetical protein
VRREEETRERVSGRRRAFLQKVMSPPGGDEEFLSYFDKHAFDEDSLERGENKEGGRR